MYLLISFLVQYILPYRFIGLLDFGSCWFTSATVFNTNVYQQKMALSRFVKFIDQGRAGVFMFFTILLLHNLFNFSFNKFVQQKMARVKRFIFRAGKSFVPVHFCSGGLVLCIMRFKICSVYTFTDI